MVLCLIQKVARVGLVDQIPQHAGQFPLVGPQILYTAGRLNLFRQTLQPMGEKKCTF